jgi:CMP-2-keto-3-deoxyoctulosonic acid synthetase
MLKHVVHMVTTMHYRVHIASDSDRIQNVMVQGSSSQAFFLDCLSLEDGTDRLSRNVGNQLPIYAV